MKCAVECNSEVEEAIKCVKVFDGVDTCTVTHLSRNYLGPQKVQNHINKFVQAVKIHRQSKNAHNWTMPVLIVALHQFNCWMRTKVAMNEQNMCDMTKK